MSRFKRTTHAIEFAGVRVALAIADLFPIGPSRAFGAGLGRLAFSVFRVRRSVSVGNVMRGLGVTQTEAEGIVKRSYENLGRSLMEFVALHRMRFEEAARMTRVAGIEHVEEARRAGRGVVLVGGHQGTWEYLGVGFGASSIPSSFLVGEQSNARVDALMNDLRARCGIELIGKGMALKHVLRALRENRLVGMLADQDAGRNGVFVDFLGQPASTAKGPAMFAVRQNCPLVCASVHRTERGMLVIECGPPIWPNPDLDEETAVRELMQYCASSLENAVRRYPDEYFWAHRRWKTQPV